MCGREKTGFTIAEPSRFEARRLFLFSFVNCGEIYAIETANLSLVKEYMIFSLFSDKNMNEEAAKAFWVWFEERLPG